MRIGILSSIAPSMIVLAALATTSCTPFQINQVILDGQLICATGPTVVAMYNASNGSAILARGKSQAFVEQVCAIINGIPVASAAVSLPAVSVVLPPTLVPVTPAPAK